MKSYTATFIQHRWFKVNQLGPGVDFEELQTDAPDSASIDEQCRAWVEQTGNFITHPGQPGVHKEQFNNNTLLCLTIAITVLYQPPPG